MYNIMRIAKIIRDVEKTLKEFREIQLNTIAVPLKSSQDSLKFHSASMLGFSMINKLIDLGNEILIKNEVGIPSKYQEIFSILFKNGFIDEKLGKEIQMLVKGRNAIAHEYLDMDEKEVLRILKKIPEPTN